MTPWSPCVRLTVLLAVMLPLALFFLPGCDTITRDPMPKWRGYSLEFGRR